MASPRVLVVDSDRSSLGLLTHGMNRFGLNSSGVADLEQARALLASERPDVVVSEVGSGPGLEVLEELRRNPATREIPVVFLAKGAWARRRAHARELGAQELIAKPAYVQDIAVLTWLYAGREASNALFEGTFGEPSCAALLRGLLAGGRTGTLRLEPFGATVRFREGAIVDASLAHLSGERALMRILTLGTGSYELTFGPLDVTPSMQFELADLAGRGLSHVHDWQQVQSQLEPLDQVLTVDYRVLSSQVSDLPPGLWNLLRLFDGKRSIAEVIEDSSLDDLTTGQALAKLKSLQLFEQQHVTRPVENAYWQDEARLRTYSIPVRPPPEPRFEAQDESAQPISSPIAPSIAQLDYEPPRFSDAAESIDQASMLDIGERAEKSFFDSPAEETSREARRDQGRRSGVMRTFGWGLVAVLALLAVVILWRGTPGAETPASAIAPAAAPAAQLQATPQVAAQPQPALAVQTAAPAPAPAPTAQNAAAQPQPTAEAAAPAKPSDQAAVQAEPAQAAPPVQAANAEPVNHAGDLLLAQAQKAYDHGQFNQALKLYDQANAIAPEDASISLGRGLTYYELGDLDRSSAAMTRVLELDPKNARAELLLGAIAQERGQAGMAKQHYKKYLELEPNGEHAAETRKLLSRLGG